MAILLTISWKKRARWFHEAYAVKKKRNRKKQQNWEELSPFMKESNRNLYNHVGTKLMLLGLKRSAGRELKQTYKGWMQKEFKRIVEKKLEMLADAEHRRWNAFYFLNGWDVLENIEKGVRKMYKTNFMPVSFPMRTWRGSNKLPGSITKNLTGKMFMVYIAY